MRRLRDFWILLLNERGVGLGWVGFAGVAVTVAVVYMFCGYGHGVVFLIKLCG